MQERKILFRGKRVDTGEWVYGYYTLYGQSRGLHPAIITGTEEGCIIPVFIDPETRGECTTLTDKNSVKIFEGDIVRIVDFQCGKIVNECGAFGVAVLPLIDWDYLDSEIACVTGCNNLPYFCRNDNFISLWELMWNYNQEEDCCDVVEIIGNIHDNPELLKE